MFTRIPLICLMIEGILLAAAVATLAPAALGAPPQGSLRAGLRRAQDENAGSNASSLQPPTLGYVGQTFPVEIRPILGIPGAASFGDQVTIPQNITQLYVSPGSSYAFVARQSASGLALIQLNGIESSELVEIPGALPAPQLIAFSPTGRTAALYANDSTRVQVLTGLPGSPRVARDLPSSTLPMHPKCLAVSDDGNALALCSGDGGVSVVMPDGAPAPVYSGVEAAAIAFLPNLSNLLVCDPGRSAVYLITGLLGMPAASPVALGTSAGSNRAWSINISSAVLEAIDLPAPAASLLPLRSSDVFLALSENLTKQPLLRNFLHPLNREELDVGHRHPLGLQQQIPQVLIAPAAVNQHTNVPVHRFHHSEAYLRAAVVHYTFEVFEQHVGQLLK